MGDLYDHLGQRCRCGHTVHSHSHGSGRCESCPCLRFDRPPKRKTAPRPTVQVMDGGMGEDGCGLGHPDAMLHTPRPFVGFACPAPTPRAP